MSPIMTEHTESGREELGAFAGGVARGFYDADLFPPARVHPFTIRRANPINLIGGHERRHARHGYSSVIRPHGQQLAAIRMAGSCLPDVTFASFDSTGVDTHRVSQWVLDLALGVGSQSQGLIEIHSEHIEERITADFDQPLDGTWLVAAFDAIFTHVAEEDGDLGFDPDNYPVI